MRNYIKLLKNENNRTQIWEAEVVGSSLNFTWGVEGGKMQTLQNTIPCGKNIGKANETTAEEQALVELRTVVNKKIQENYEVVEVSGLADMEYDEARESPKPMLAHEFNKHKHKIGHREIVYYQGKSDGCRSNVDLLTGRIYSRKGKLITCLKHLNEQVKTFGQTLIDGIPICEIVRWYDGELYSHSIPFEKITSIVRKSKSEDPDAEKIELHIYDCMISEMNFGARNLVLKDWARYHGTHMKLVETFQGFVDEVDKYHLRFVEQGYEGVMIRRSTKGYQHKRTDELLKLKLFITEEFEITGLNREEFDDTLGTFACIGANGSFDCRPAMTDKERQEIWQNRESFDYKDNVLSVKYQELTADGIPRFPVGKLRWVGDLG